jgi:succinate dehydrogenase/fumarate reductase cytochrome b subunit
MEYIVIFIFLLFLFCVRILSRRGYKCIKNENGLIEIPLNKVSYGFSLIFSCLFGITGIFLIICPFVFPPSETNVYFFDNILLNPLIQVFTGILAIIFCVFIFNNLYKKFIDKKPGLVIDDTGITDNCSVLTAKHIKWENIIKIKNINLLIVQFISIYINNPDEYIKQFKSRLSLKMLKWDKKMVGTPINISVDSLKCKPKELISILQSKLMANTEKNESILQSAFYQNYKDK